MHCLQLFTQNAHHEHATICASKEKLGGASLSAKGLLLLQQTSNTHHGCLGHTEAGEWL